MIDIKKIWLTDTAIWIQTADGKQACENFADYASLRNASKAERLEYSCSPFGVHWPHLDEDLSYEGFFTHYPLVRADVKYHRWHRQRKKAVVAYRRKIEGYNKGASERQRKA